MNKLIISACSIAVAAALITPKLVSNHVKSQVEDIVAEVNAIHGYQATIAELNSDWFNTTGKVRLNIDFVELGADDVHDVLDNFYIDVNIDAQHGPILTKAESLIGLVNMSVNLSHQDLRKYLSWDAEKPLYNASVLTDILGNTSYVDVIQPFTITDEENAVRVSYEGFEGAGEYNSGNLSYVGKSKPTNITVEDVKMYIGDIDVDMVAKASFADMLQTGLYDSESTFTVNTFTLNNEVEDVNAKLDNISIEAISKVDEAKDVASLALTYAIDSVNAEDFKASDMALAMEFNNISKTFVTAYQDNAEMFSQGSEEEIQANLLKFAQENLLPLLTSEPEFKITSLRATLEDGIFESHFTTRLNGISQLPNIVENPMFWLPHLSADGEIKGNKKVIKSMAQMIMESQIRSNPDAAEMTEEQIAQVAQQQVPQLLQAFIQQGFIVESETEYQSNFMFKNTALTVNNNPVPFAI
ncbi:MAG: YdgA family protein [Thalassotalea sp.]|nr:YdgA family protein [Thalassotalea sp.]